MDKTEKCLKENKIFEGRVVTLFNDDVITPKGNKTNREYISHPGGVCCLAIYDNLIYFEKQFRYPYHKEILELPAGKLEKTDTDVFEAMRRELKEEIGFVSEDLEYLGYMYPSVGCSNEVIHLFFSPINKIGSTDPDEDEVIEVIKLSPKEAYELLDKGDIHDAKTVILLEKLRKVLLK